MQQMDYCDDFSGGKLDPEHWDFAFWGSPGSQNYTMPAEGGILLAESARQYAGACGVLSRAGFAKEACSVAADIERYEYGAAVALYDGVGGWNHYLQLAVLQGKIEACVPSGVTINDTLMHGAQKEHVLFCREGSFPYPCTLELQRTCEQYTVYYNGEELGSFHYKGIGGDARVVLKSMRDPRPVPDAAVSHALFRRVSLRGLAPTATIAGTVAEPSGRPIEGAVVHAAGYGYGLSALTDRSGHFQLKEAPRGRLELIAAAEGHLFSACRVDVPQGNGELCITLEPETAENLPRREYNRPDFDRSARWLNLNGTWEFEFDRAGVGEGQQWYRRERHPFGMRLKVPFSWSSLEGHGEGFLADNNAGLEANPFYCNYEITGEIGWYRRNFTVPTEFAGEDVVLKIGAANAVTTVWCDGKYAGTASDNYGELEFDLGAMEPESEHVLAIRVRFPYDIRSICLGKQHWWFTQCPGIWQTVWIEPRRERYIAGITCDSTVTFTQGKATADLLLRVQASARADRILWNAAGGRPIRICPGKDGLFQLEVEKAGFFSVDIAYAAPNGDCACDLSINGRNATSHVEFIGTLGEDTVEHVRLLPRLHAGENKLNFHCMQGGRDGLSVHKIAGSAALRPLRAVVSVHKPDGSPLGRYEFALVPEEGKETLAGEKRVHIPEPALWDAGAAQLYRVTAELFDGDSEPEDRVGSYFGLRKIETRWAPGHGPGEITEPSGQYQYLYLNDQPFYMRGILDQGYNPWGLHTYRAYASPAKGSICRDVDKAKEYGFNMLRMHIKENEPLWYYYCDLAGVPVWTEHPGNVHAVPENSRWRSAYRRELRAMVRRNRCHPSVLLYSTINESWGIQGKECSSPWDVHERQDFQKEMALLCRHLDPARLVCDNSGFGKTQAGQINDFHSYPASYDEAVWEWGILASKIYPGSTYNYYNAANGAGQVGGETQTGCVALISEFLHTDSMEQLVRRFPQFGGYVRMNLASAQGEDYSPMTATREERQLGFLNPDFTPAGYAMVNRSDLIAFDSSRHRCAQAGTTFKADVFISHFSLADLSECRIAWRFYGVDLFGFTTSPLLQKSFRLSVPIGAVTQAGTVHFQVPAEIAGGYLFVELLSEETVLASNYIFLEVTGGKTLRESKNPSVFAAQPGRPLRGGWDEYEGNFEKNERSIAWGKNNGFYEYLFTPQNSLPQGRLTTGRLMFEAAARSCADGVNQTDQTCEGTILRASVCGIPVGHAEVPDDPFDERALFTYATFGGEPFRYERMGRFGYGYRVVFELDEEALRLIADCDPSQGIPVRIEAEGGGMTLYGYHTGRYGFDPMLLLNTEKPPENT